MFCLRLFFGFSTKFHQHKRLEVPFRSNKTNSYFSHLAFSNLTFIFPFSNFWFNCRWKPTYIQEHLLWIENWKVLSPFGVWCILQIQWKVFDLLTKKYENFSIYINRESSRLVLCINWKVERESLLKFDAFLVERLVGANSMQSFWHNRRCGLSMHLLCRR